MVLSSYFVWLGSRTSRKRKVKFGEFLKFQFLFKFFAFSIIESDCQTIFR